VDKTNEAIDALHSGECLRAVVNYSAGSGPAI
jgi:Zn-dependent alcohol dehydrogenase